MWCTDRDDVHSWCRNPFFPTLEQSARLQSSAHSSHRSWQEYWCACTLLILSGRGVYYLYSTLLLGSAENFFPIHLSICEVGIFTLREDIFKAIRYIQTRFSNISKLSCKAVRSVAKLYFVSLRTTRKVWCFGIYSIFRLVQGLTRI